MARQFEKRSNRRAIVIRARRVLVRVIVRTNDDDLVFVLPPRKLGADIEEGFALGFVPVQQGRIAGLPQ